jgi:hypothetical protein
MCGNFSGKVVDIASPSSDEASVMLSVESVETSLLRSKPLDEQVGLIETVMTV